MSKLFKPYVENKRYKLFVPSTGKVESWTRVTTFADTLPDTSALTEWKRRMVARGMGLRPDLVETASRADPTTKEGRATLTTVAAVAHDQAGGNDGANDGTALHNLTEALDRGAGPVIPERFQPDVAAYQNTMSEAGAKVLDDMIEVVVIVPELKLVGTVDRVLVNRAWGGLPRIGDLKTQQRIYTHTSIAIQLAVYSRATHYWSDEHNTLMTMPTVDQDRAVMMHLPVGGGECRLLNVDVAEGWQAALVTQRVRQLRSQWNRSLITDTAGDAA